MGWIGMAVGGQTPRKAEGRMDMMGRERGFSLVEMIVAMGVMVLVIASVLQMLSQSQQRFVTTAAQEDSTAAGREALDLMTREIRLSGYPPPNSYPAGVITGTNQQYVAIGGGFLVANPYAIQFEADIGIPAGCGGAIPLADQRCTSNTGVVSVINYEIRVPTGGNTGGCAGLTVDAALTSPTLMRSQVPKLPSGAAVTPVFVPFVNNVINCNLGLPMFTYCPAAAMGFTIPSLPWPGAPCPNMSAMPRTSLPAGPRRTRVVLIRIQTQTQNRDPQTGQFYTVEFFNVAQRVNPDQ